MVRHYKLYKVKTLQSIQITCELVYSFIVPNKDKTALRTAVDNDGTLDKEATHYNDIFDAFRLVLWFYRFQDPVPSIYDLDRSLLRR